MLALDIGSSRIKALLADWDGRVLDVHDTATPRQATEPGEQAYPLDAVLATVVNLIADLAASRPQDRVDTLVFSCLGTAMAPLDRDGRPLGPALAPADTRPLEGPPAAELTGLDAKELFDRTGSDPAVASFLLHAMWWQRAHPAVAERVDRYRSLRGYALQELCGADVEDRSWASRTMLFDLEQDGWSDHILDAAGLPAGAFPPIELPTAAFEVRAPQVSRLGLAPGAVAVLGAMDNCCSLLGADGPDRSGLVNIVGTYEHMAGAAGLAEVREVAGAAGAIVHAYLLPGRYITMTRTPIGPLLAQAAAGVEGGLEALMADLSDTPTGAVMALEQEAVAAAIEAGTSPGAIVQALIESATDVLRRFAEAWAGLGLAHSPIAAVGGGARQTRTLQLKADLLGRTVVTLESVQAAGLGALRLAAMARRGLDAESAAELFGNPITRTFEPREVSSMFQSQGV